MPVIIPVIVGAIAGKLGSMILEDLMSPKPVNEGEDAFLKGLKQNQGKRLKDLPPPAPVQNPDLIQNYDNSTVSYNTQNIFIQNNFYFTPVLAPTVNINLLSIPPRRLPKEADGQTTYYTPVGNSITVKEALTERKFGRLLHRPLNNKTYKFRVAKYDKLAAEFAEKNNRGKDRLSYWMAAQTAIGYEAVEDLLPPDGKRIKWDVKEISPDLDEPLSLWDATAIIGANSLKGFRGDIGLIFGLEALHVIAKDFNLSRINAYQEITGLIPMDYEIVEYEPEIKNTYKETEVNFSATHSALIPAIYDILGGDIWKSDIFKNGEVSIEGWLRSAGFEQYTKDSENNKVAPKNLFDLMRHYLATLYFRSGFHRLPAEVPESLIQDSDPNKNKDIEISDALHFQEWQTRALDALIGQFPIEIEIEDSDLIKVGDQKLKIPLPNIAETLAELMGLSITLKSFMDANLNASMRTLAETGSARKQAIINHYLIASIQDYLGFKSRKKVLDVDFLFNPKVGTDSDTPELLSEALKTTKMKVEIEECDDDHSLEARMTTLAEAAAIIKAVHWRKVNLNDMGELKSFFKNIVDFVGETEEKKEDEFDEFIEKVEDGFINEPGMLDTTNPYGRPYDQRPKIRKLEKPT
jgi:hypothetical protein